MEWLVLVLWILVLLVALPLGRASFVAPSFGLQAVAALAGLGLCILFMFDGALGVAWGSFAAAVVGALAVGAGVPVLTSDRRPLGALPQHREERDALFAGIALSLFGVIAGVALLMALDVANVT